MEPAFKPGSTVQANIRSVADMQQSLEESRTMVDRIADLIGGFSGSMSFVAIHIVWFTLWFLINTGVFPFIPKFDPFPFILLAMIVSVEGVLLSTFVLMKQNRMQRRSDIRDHLNLQIDLLAEKEVTKSLQLLLAICREMKIHVEEKDPELHEMANTTSIEIIAQHVYQLPQD